MIGHKTCKTCGAVKNLSMFHKRCDCELGVEPHCKDCKKAKRGSRAGCPKVKAYNKEYAKTRVQEYTPKMALQAAERYKSNRNHALGIQENYRLRNKSRFAAKEGRRRATKLNATPQWLTDEQKYEISMIYMLARDCSLTSGMKYHVDHIEPLKGKDICGLHVPWNLQVLPADINLSKSNRRIEN